MAKASPLTDDDRVISAINTTVAVAIDTDRNSPYAVRWTIDHLLNSNPHIILIHVSHRFLQNQDLGLNEENPNGYQESIKDILKLFLPYRGYCARKGVQIKEVVLDDFDVSKALVDYLNVHRINNIVVGASTNNSISRNSDVATCLIKSAPDFSTVYVISKGNVQSSRSATRLLPLNSINGNGASPIQSQPTQKAFPQLRAPENSNLDDEVKESCRPTGAQRRVLGRSSNVKIRQRSRTRSTCNSLSMDYLNLPVCVPRISISCDSFDSYSLDYGSLDIDYVNEEFSIVSDDSPISNSSSQSSPCRKDEMKRLRLELKQTMDLYSTACKEAILAKKKVEELHQWKMEEGRKVEEAKFAEETALAMAEMEKAKRRAAIESAQSARKLAEKEASRRRRAELKAKREAEEKMRAVAALHNNDVRYRRYTIDEIEAATNSFTESLKIGEGGYGPVYKGLLDHTPVAIKVLRPDAHHGKQQFQQEVEVLSSIRHPNMVLLLGACPEFGCLVYEYMENGSLEDKLLRRDNTPTIPWKIRFRIAAEIATALLFLHQNKPEPFVHRDLKPANILLDSNYVSKISDVGLARLVPPSVANSVTQYRMTNAAGTFCYIDPEYQKTGLLGIKSDVYSLGIMLLQIITAKPAMGLTHHVENAIVNGTFEEVLDPTVPDWPVQETLEYAKVAIKCAELRRKDRPELGSEVLPVLNRLRNLRSKAESRIDTSQPPTSNTNSLPNSRFSNQICSTRKWKQSKSKKSCSWRGKICAQNVCCINRRPTVVEETNTKQSKHKCPSACSFF
ncbi:U-box domain-containing protein 52-like isoform X2 [Macadamia integrifolia]|uniref:U-box domain-containing protein 52-like isoform X2 n=1 Tax=Macadamia integrifolia TaxID=60698 RepID=UPI001C4ECBB0|nr:U-box domain-containing protein 52-like isoform X2 [Macadamia integrifolia]